MRKILLSILLTLVLVVPFASAESADYLGIWYANEIVMGEMVLSAASMGLEMTLDIRADGTAVMNAAGMETVGSWTIDADGSIVIDDGMSVTTGAVMEGRLVTESEGALVVLDRELAAAADPIPEASTDVAAEDFIGTWTGAEVDAGGVRVPMSMTGFDMTIEVRADGGFALSSEALGQNTEGTWVLDGYTLVATSEGSDTGLTLRGGRLALESSGTLILFDLVP